MTRQDQDARSWAGQIHRGGQYVRNPNTEPVFFFDGDFRTWAQVERRAQLNRAIAEQVARTAAR